MAEEIVADSLITNNFVLDILNSDEHVRFAGFVNDKSQILLSVTKKGS